MTRYLSRSAMALMLCTALISMTACNTAKLVDLAERSGKVAVKLKPVVAPLVASGQLPANLLVRIDQFQEVTAKLADAFRNGGTGNADALELTAKAIEYVETFINSDAIKIKDQGTRTLVLAILAGADIALGEISDALSSGAAKQPVVRGSARAAKPTETATIEEFAKKPRLRCRDAKTGRFAKMEVCEANPATTIVERVR